MSTFPVYVTVIVPFYKGNKYLKGLKENLEKSCLIYSQKVEVIIVNDSPGVEVKTNLINSKHYDLNIINHSKNLGIHQARVTGVKQARGKYILLLDQDDKINPLFFKNMTGILELNSNYDFAFSNGLFETDNGEKKLILNSYGKVYAAHHYDFYLRCGNILASPGQCLIRRDRIPEIWLTKIMKTNCSDDLLLWILLLESGRPIYVNEILYEHISTGENVSSDRIKGYLSDIELCNILLRHSDIPQSKINSFKIKQTIKYNREIGKKYNHVQFIKKHLLELNTKMYIRMLGFIYRLSGNKICQFDKLESLS